MIPQDVHGVNYFREKFTNCGHHIEKCKLVYKNLVLALALGAGKTVLRFFSQKSVDKNGKESRIIHKTKTYRKDRINRC